MNRLKNYLDKMNCLFLSCIAVSCCKGAFAQSSQSTSYADLADAFSEGLVPNLQDEKQLKTFLVYREANFQNDRYRLSLVLNLFRDYMLAYAPAEKRPFREYTIRSNSRKFSVRSLFLIDSFFSSYFFGQRFSAAQYPLFSMHPAYHFFTVSRDDGTSLGLVVVVLGSAGPEKLGVVVDYDLSGHVTEILDAVRRSLAEEGYQLAIILQPEARRGQIRDILQDLPTTGLKIKKFRPISSLVDFPTNGMAVFQEPTCIVIDDISQVKGSEIHSAPSKNKPDPWIADDLNIEAILASTMKLKNSSETNVIRYIRSMQLLRKFAPDFLDPKYYQSIERMLRSSHKIDLIFTASFSLFDPFSEETLSILARLPNVIREKILHGLYAHPETRSLVEQAQLYFPESILLLTDMDHIGPVKERVIRQTIEEHAATDSLIRAGLIVLENPSLFSRDFFDSWTKAVKIRQSSPRQTGAQAINIPVVLHFLKQPLIQYFGLPQSSRFNREQLSPCVIAARMGFTKALKKLIDVGASCSAQETYEAAALTGQVGVIKLLQSQDIVAPKLELVVAIAKNAGHEDVASVLIAEEPTSVTEQESEESINLAIEDNRLEASVEVDQSALVINKSIAGHEDTGDHLAQAKVPPSVTPRQKRSVCLRILRLLLRKNN